MARILVVDDSAVNRELLHAYLEGTGHTLIDADSGEKALDLAAQHNPDLVLLDVLMPGIGGIETTRRLKEKAGATFLPIILVTSLSDRVSRILGLEAGADEFLSNPVDAHELHARIRTLLELRAKETALAEQNLELMEHDRFRAEMTSFIVHDLRGLVSVIVVNHDFLCKYLEGESGMVIAAIQDSRAAAQRVLNLLANLLDVASMEASRLELKLSAVHVRTLFDQIITEHRLYLRTRRLAVNVVADAALRVEADADILSRVLENLIENAIRYTPSGGRIVLRADSTDEKARIRVGNTGTSIPLAARSLIFEKYGQASSDHGRLNLGLGLYFCRLAVEAHGGRIWVDETPEIATEFVVELPLLGRAEMRS